MATVYFIGGLDGQLGNPFLNLASAFVVFSAAVFFLYTLFVLFPHKSRLGLLVWFLILLVLLTEIVLGLVPPAARDELTHHLALPKLYVKSGKIFEVPFAPYSYYPMLLDMLYIPFVKWGWDSVPKLIHGLFGFFTGLLIYAYLTRRLHPVYGLLGLLSFVSTPIVLKLGNLAYVDLGMTFFATASLLCLLRWVEDLPARRWLILSGLSAGFCVATKPNGFLVFLLLSLFIIFIVARKSQERFRAPGGWAAVFILLALVPFTPWLVKNMFQTGNPLFPFFGDLFRATAGSGALLRNVIGTGGLGIFTEREMLYGENGWEIATLPFRIFFTGQDDNPQYFDGVLNPFLILFLPWAFKGKWGEEKRVLLAFSLLYLLYALFLTGLRIRYVLPMVPPLVILMVYGIHNIYLRIVHPSILFAVVALLLTFNGSYLLNYFQVVSPLDYLQGRESRQAYLTRMLSDYPAVQYVNEKLPPGARIYLLFMGRRTYYYERETIHDGGDNPWLLLSMIQSAPEAKELRATFMHRHFTHLVVRDDLLRRFLANNLDAEKLRLWNDFTNCYLERLFEAQDYSVYRIHG